MAEPNETQVDDEAAYVPWSDAEKYSFLTQVICQTNGFTNNAEVRYERIKLPGRSKAAMEMMWQKMKAEAVHTKMEAAKVKDRMFNNQADSDEEDSDEEDSDQEDSDQEYSSEEDSAPYSSGELVVVPKTFPTLPPEMRLAILGHMLDEPRVLEIFFESLPGTSWCHQQIKWTEQTDCALSASTALLHINREARVEFFKRYQFQQFVPNTSPVAINVSQDIVYFGIGTSFNADLEDGLLLREHVLKGCNIKRVAFDNSWCEAHGTMEFFMLFGEWWFANVTEVIIVVGSECEEGKYFQRATNSLREVTQHDVLSDSEAKVKIEVEAFWKTNGGENCACSVDWSTCKTHNGDTEFLPDSGNYIDRTSLFRNGELIKLKFMKLVRTFDYPLLSETPYKRGW